MFVNCNNLPLLFSCLTNHQRVWCTRTHVPPPHVHVYTHIQSNSTWIHIFARCTATPRCTSPTCCSPYMPKEHIYSPHHIGCSEYDHTHPHSWHNSQKPIGKHTTSVPDTIRLILICQQHYHSWHWHYHGHGPHAGHGMAYDWNTNQADQWLCRNSLRWCWCYSGRCRCGASQRHPAHSRNILFECSHSMPGWIMKVLDGLVTLRCSAVYS